METPPISYAVEPAPDPIEVVEVFRLSGLPNPISNPQRMAQLIRTGDIIVCAREDGRLVGFARAMCDFLYTCYISDLVVDADCQGRGIARELIRRIQDAAGEGVRTFLFAAPDAEAFYRRIGCRPADDCWTVHSA